MPLVQFVGQSARDADNVSANPSRLINCYGEPLLPGGRSTRLLRSVMGTTSVIEVPAVFARAMEVVDDKVFAVIGGNVLRLRPTPGTFAVLGSVPDGTASIAGNNGAVAVVAGGVYRVWNGTTLLSPVLPLDAFTPGSVDTISNYTVVTEAGGRRFFWSDVADATDLPGLNFSTADGKDDNLVRGFGMGGRLYLFKERSHEVWFVTGSAGSSAFQRMAGGVFDIGLKSHDLICRVESGAFFVGHDGVAYLIGDGQRQPVSTPPVTTALRNGVPVSAFSYMDEGHVMCCVTFMDRPAWCYDVATGEWHERAEGSALEPWGARVSALWQGTWYLAKADGTVSRLDRSGTDGAQPLVREATSTTLFADGERIVLREFEAFPRLGVGNGSLGLSLSRDGGMTWGLERSRPIGPVGRYGQRVIWRALGQYRQVTARLRWAGPADVSVEASARIVT